jgi:hypothetical protein
MSVDAVLSYHMNPQTCGVAKFNHALAKRLGVPCLPIGMECDHPLVSIKPEELSGWIGVLSLSYDLFLHGYTSGPLVTQADRVYAGNEDIAERLRVIRPDVITAFCPSTVEGNPDRGGYRVLTFGMSHKLVLPHFEQLKRDLERDHPDYTISLSTAVHEGNPWDEALTTSVEAMRGIFGDRLRVLGFLADDALARELQECDAVAAFFVPAFRANNTSAWAALAANKFLYTNLDAQSPALDPEAYGWDALLKVLA